MGYEYWFAFYDKKARRWALDMMIVGVKPIFWGTKTYAEGQVEYNNRWGVLPH